MTELSNTKKTKKAVKKNNTGTKASAGSKKINKAQKAALQKKQQFIRGEAMAIIVCFLSVFLFLSNFSFLGSVGEFTGGVMKGLFGGLSYVLPILLLLAVFYAVSKRGEPLFGLKMGALCVSILLIPGLIQLMFGDKALLISESFEAARSGLLKKYSAGGLMGTLLANGLRSAIGSVGAYLLLFALILIAIVIITEKSMIGLAKTGARKTAAAAKKGGEKAKVKIGESRVRHDMRREANALKRKEEKFEKEIEKSRPSIANGRFDLKASEETYNYPVCDSELLGEEIPEEAYVEPAAYAGTSYSMENTVSEGVSGFAAAEESVPLTEAEPDYGIDEVPFDETEEERYKAYGKMLLSGKLDSQTAENLGFAVSRGQNAKMPDPVIITPVSNVSTAESVMKGAAVKAVSAVSDTVKVHFEEQEIYLDDECPASDGEKNLHAPALPEEIEYPEAVIKEAEPESCEALEEEYPEETYDEPEVILSSKKHEDEALLKITRVREETAEPEEQEIPPVPEKSAEAAYEELQKKREEEKKKAEQEGTPKVRPYQFPPVNLLTKGVRNKAVNTDETKENARKLEEVLQSFGVGVTVTDVVRGPRVTRYELTPDVGVKVSRITALAGDIKLALAAKDLRIEAPIPGKSAVGIEIANKESATVTFRDIMDTEEFRSAKSKLTWGVGLDIQGSPVVGDIAKMPHLLVSGTTGSGKSVGINSIIMSVIYRARPEEVRMLLVDPKVVELSVYDGIPHLLAPVVTKPAEALAVLNKACEEMNARYRLFKESNTRNIKGYNEKVEEVCRQLPDDEEKPEKLPYILIIIDELSELMMHSKRDVESAIVSLTQLARAAGIHLVVATQRPSVDVVTGLIKSNIPSRVAYRLPSGVDSRTVLDSYGAESLLGNGDMLYKPGDKNNPLRVQGAYLSDEEVESIVDWLKKHNTARYSDEWEESMKVQPAGDPASGGAGMDMTSPADDGRDEYFAEAGRLIIEKKKASIGSLQRKFKVGFNRAARIMEQLCDAGVVSEGEGTKERQILMTLEEFREKFGNGSV